MINISVNNESKILEIVIDDNGITQFIALLSNLKKSKDHEHLIMGIDLSKGKNLNDNWVEYVTVYHSESNPNL